MERNSVVAGVLCAVLKSVFDPTSGRYCRPVRLVSSGELHYPHMEVVEPPCVEVWKRLACVVEQLTEWHQSYVDGRKSIDARAADAIYRTLLQVEAWRASVLSLADQKWTTQHPAAAPVVAILRRVHVVPAALPSSPDESARIRHALRSASGDDARELRERLEDIGG